MDIKKELIQISSMLHIARGNCEVLLKDYAVSGTQLDCILNQSERAVIRLRTLAEAVRSRPVESGNKPAAPEIPGFVGKIEVSDFSWVHITLNSLLPSCKYKTPYWLQNTLSALLTGYQKNGRRLPRFERAMLIIEEHCDLQSRQVYDQDNKGWKAIPNAMKGGAGAGQRPIHTGGGVALPSVRNGRLSHLGAPGRGGWGILFCSLRQLWIWCFGAFTMVGCTPFFTLLHAPKNSP